jgi:MFS family permease
MRGLDWFTFFLADIQTGFGPFVAVYLTAQAWSQGDIGLILTIGGLVALAGQIPAGALVDAARSTRFVVLVALVAISASAVAIAGWPIFLVVLGSRVVHAAASCLLGPAIAALSLNLVGHAALGERLGRNARFASIGAGISALAMGATGHFYTNQGVFIFCAILVIPALAALSQIRPAQTLALSGADNSGAGGRESIGALFGNRLLLTFAACIVLFHLANAAMLPLMSGLMTNHIGSTAMMWVAACLVVPQVVVAAFAPLVGRTARSWGRRPLLILCFAVLVLRGVLFALTSEPYLIVAAQALDGVSAALIGVLFPLIIADIAGKTGRFNLALGIVGSAMGIGAALSTTLAGFAFDAFGGTVAFFGMAFIAAIGLVMVFTLMPETRPNETQFAEARRARVALSQTA